MSRMLLQYFHHLNFTFENITDIDYKINIIMYENDNGVYQDSFCAVDDTSTRL